MTYSDGSVYDGKWDNDSRCGFGVFAYKNGDSYTGHWKMDKENGDGSYRYASGVIQMRTYIMGQVKKN